MEPGRNYITREGARRLATELRALVEVERPRVVQEVADAAAQGDRSENAEYIYGKKRLREIDRKIRHVTGRLDRAVVVEAGDLRADRVYFGAEVTVQDEEGHTSRYRLVGEDEADPAQGALSWKSPFGRALLGRRPGEVVTVRRPRGELELEILSVGPVDEPQPEEDP